MTEEKAFELFNKWVRILGLENWDIKLYWKTREMDMSIKESYGCTTYLHESRQAVIQMLDPVDCDDLRPFKYDYEKTLIHELLHVKFADLEDSGDQLRDKLTHQMIDDIARAFIKCSKGE